MSATVKAAGQGGMLRRWVILLAVMELAVLAIYVPVVGPGLRPGAVLYPESLVRTNGEVGADEVESLDASRPARAAVTIASYGVLVGCWLVALYWLSRCDGRLDRRTLAVVLAGAAVLAVSLWGLPPTFSDDTYRYRWDGLAAASGFNPYEIKPDSLWQLKQTQPQLYWQTDFRWRPTIYPPFAVMLFAANGIAGNTMLGWRVLLLAAEGLLAWGCWRVLCRRGLAAGWLAAVLLCPLLILETHLDGHLEIVPVALVVAAVVALDDRRWWGSAVMLALAVNVKYLWPGLATLLLLGRLYRQRRLLAGGAAFAAVLVACWVPFVLMTWSNPQAIDPGEHWASWMPLPLRLVLKAPREFLERWNFNAAFYKVLAIHFAPESPAPKLIALGVLLGLAGALIIRRRWWMDTEDITLVLAAALLLSPVSYPWYFLWLVPGLVLPGPGALWGRQGRGPPVWIVLWLAMLPALHEFLPVYFKTRQSPQPFPAVPWLIVAAVAPLLTAAWVLRLARPIWRPTDAP